MPDEIDRLFERFRAGGDPDALGRVFDATAPRLLQLAIHFVGDIAAAEDLVQATFVTAIERAATFDGTHSLNAWLSGILANHARALQRAARREIDTAALAQRIESTPLEQALDAEWSAALAQALDRIPEPYRLVLILRLQYGMEPTEIAHALQRSPGAVRVQLHRGREMLRKELPAGILASALFIAESARGMAHIKANVLAQAAALKSTAGVAAIVGGVFMSTKVVVGSIALLVALAALWFLQRDRFGRIETSAALASLPVANAPIDGSPPKASAELAPTETTTNSQRAEIANAAPVLETDTVQLRGRVVDADTNEGIAGADVALFAPRTMRLCDIRSRWHDRIWQSWNGSIYGAGWPRFDPELTAESAVELDEVPVYAADDKAEPVVRTRTDDHGEFAIVASKSLGFVACTANGYVPNQVALTPSKASAANAREISIEIAMRAPRRLVGHIVDDQWKRIERSVRLRFNSRMRMSARATKNVDGSPVRSFEPNEDDPQVEATVVQTQPDGGFEFETSATIMNSVDCLDPDLEVVKYGCLRENRTKLVNDGTTWPQPGLLKEPLVIVLRPITWIRVTDRVTHEPIEKIQMLCTSKSTTWRMLRHGAFFAPHGCLRLTAWWSVLDETWRRAEEEAPCTCTVWADGYLAQSRDLNDLIQPMRVDFELERGNAPVLAGHIHEGERPIVGAKLSLSRLLSNSWNTSSLDVIAAAKSDAKGAFRTSLPAGRYVMTTAYGDDKRWQVVELPLNAPLDIDLSVHTSIVANVRDASGIACDKFTVELNGSDGRWVKRDTDESGVVCFADLPPGSHVLKWSASRYMPRHNGDPELSVAVQTGESEHVDISLAGCTPHFARLVVDGLQSFSGWKACVHNPETSPWIDVERSGRIPIDLCGVRDIRIANANGRQWTQLFPKDVPDAYVIHLELGGIGYTGILIAQESGQPLAKTRVVTIAWEPKDRTDTTVSAVTDENGRFELTGLADHEYALRFEDVPRTGSFTHEWIFVHPVLRPGTPLTELTITLPKSNRRQGAFNSLEGFDGIQQIRLSGTIRMRSKPLPNTSGRAWSILPGAGYSMLLQSDFAVAADGTYDVHLPAAPSYEVTLRDTTSGLTFADVEWAAGSSGDREAHDIELP
jgi:RNA polymerase sigma-70 factor (ECF subfamily)